jgi:DNA end-binding protein Ku
MRGKAYAVAIFADRGILRAETLRFGDEVRTAKDVQLPEPEHVDDKSVAKMAARVEGLSQPSLDEAELRDEATEDLVAVARRKLERGEDVVEVAEEAAEAGEAAEQGGAEVVDLMALLKQRMKEGSRGGRQARNGGGTKGGGRAAPGGRARGHAGKGRRRAS